MANFLSKYKKLMLILIIIALAAFFRFYKITEIPPGLYPDEAMNGNNALEALATGDYKIFYPENNGREGLFINLQAISLWFFGNKAWVLRIASAFLGIITILGLFLLVYELFRNYSHSVEKETKESVTFDTFLPHGLWIATLSSFFLAVSYWHINFSRIGFRAIMVPFFLVFGFYFLFKAFRTGKIFDTVWAGIFSGLGFHTYIAFRLVPLILIFVLGWKLRQWFKGDSNATRIHSNDSNTNAINSSHSSAIRILESPQKPKFCAPCLISLFLFVTFIVALPVGWYFLNHPADFMGRQAQVSIFDSENPLKEFLVSNIKTLGMFNFRGDCNQRHNFNCEPELFWPVGILFLAGVYYSVSHIWRYVKNKSSQGMEKTSGVEEESRYKRDDGETPDVDSKNIDIFPHLFLVVWFLVMTLSATLTKEGLPHALRSIGLIIPVFIFVGLGSSFLLHQLFYRFHLFYDGKERLNHEHKRVRIGAILFLAFLIIFVSVNAYDTYFKKFSGHAKTYFEFSTGLYRIGEYVAGMPKEINKYIIVNMDGVDVHGIPMPAQTVMFLTDSYREASRKEKNIFYLLPNQLSIIANNLKPYKAEPSGFRPKTYNLQPAVIILLNPFDKELVSKIKEKLPEFKIFIPEREFYVFKNY